MKENKKKKAEIFDNGFLFFGVYCRIKKSEIKEGKKQGKGESTGKRSLRATMVTASVHVHAQIYFMFVYTLISIHSLKIFL